MRSWILPALLLFPAVALADADGDGWDAPDDCNDGDLTIHPFAVELCDNVDNDCNGVTDDLEVRWFADRDLDGYGDSDEYVDACPGGGLPALGAGGQWVLTSGDCNNADPGVSPARTEFCDGIDNDCDGQIDDGLAADTIWHVDHDHDGFGRVSSNGSVQGACPPNLDYTSWSPIPTDCDDTDPTVHPLITVDDWDHPPLWGLEEFSEQDRDPAYVGDGIDQDCDAVDLCYVDADDDKFGETGADGQRPDVIADNNLSCRDRSLAYTADNSQDCDDEDRRTGPGAAETVGDGIDQDCDGHDLCYVDADQDGWGTAEEVPATGSGCGLGTDPTADRAGDCDDSSGTGPGVRPDALEVCDGLDNNCDGQIDEVSSPDATVWFQDADGDGWGDVRFQIKACGEPVGYVAEAGDCNDAEPSTFPENEEVCDGIDNNCRSGIDEQDVCATTTQQPTSGGGCHAPWGGAYAMFPILLPMSWFRRRETKPRA